MIRGPRAGGGSGGRSAPGSSLSGHYPAPAPTTVIRISFSGGFLSPAEERLRAPEITAAARARYGDR